MSSDSNNMSTPDMSVRSDSVAGSPARWGATTAVFFTFAVFLVTQAVAYVLIRGLARAGAPWVRDATIAQFLFILLAEAATLCIAFLFMKSRGAPLALIGLRRPRLLDAGLAFVGMLVYLIAFYAVAVALTVLIPSFDINQKQQIGFDGVHQTWQLALTFISLVILAPIAEEIMFRGFLYRGLRWRMRFVPAMIWTSVCFAFLHLFESSSGLLWIAGVDTFILSLVLVYLREKTDRLYAGIGVHMLKNGLAFLVLFVAPTLRF